MKLVAAILLAQLAFSAAFPLDSAPASAKTTNIHTPGFSSGEASASAREVRGAVSKSGSEVGPDGHLKSSAIAAKTGEDYHGPSGSGGPVVDPVPTFAPAPVPVPDEGHNNNNNNNGNGGGQNNNNNNNGPEPMPVPTSAPVAPAPVSTVAPIVPGGHGQGKIKSFQKVAATANKDTGTAIASATNKRDTTNVQKADASGNVAIAKTKNTKNGDGTSFQKSDAKGEKLAVATSENGRIFKRDAVKNVQVVKAQGNKAISTAVETKGSATNLQQVAATGGDLAVAKASSGTAIRDVEPLPFTPPKSLQVVSASGNNAISKAQHTSTGPGGESTQMVQASGGALGVATAVNS